MRISNAGNNRWSVLSDSGNTYTVRLRTCLDEMGSMYFRWQCTCPARGHCKHITAVEAETEPVDEQAAERIA